MNWVRFISDFTKKYVFLSELENRGSKINLYKVEQTMGYSCFEMAVTACFRNIKYPNDEC